MTTNLHRVRILFGLFLLVSFAAISCTTEETVSQDDYDNLALLTAATAASHQLSAHELNGYWKSFIGNGTTFNTLRTFSAHLQGNGNVLGISTLDGSGFSSCSFIVAFDNNANTMITQNPPFNGACFAGDTNKGRYFKEIWIDGPTAGSYWTCTLNSTGVDSIAAAQAIVDNTTKTDPGTTGCNGFSWSRLERAP